MLRLNFTHYYLQPIPTKQSLLKANVFLRQWLRLDKMLSKNSLVRKCTLKLKKTCANEALRALFSGSHIFIYLFIFLPSIVII